MKGRAGQGAKKLDPVWWDFLKKQNSYLHLFGVGQKGNRHLRAASCQPKVALQHLTEIQHFLTGAWRAISAINTSPHYGLVQFPGCKADFVPPLLCKWDTKTLPGFSEAKGLPVNCKSHFCVFCWSAAPSNPFPICWDLFLHFLFRQCILAHIGFHSLLHNCFVHTSISLLIVLLVASTVLKYIWRKPQKKVTAHYMDCFDILISLCLSIVLENEGQWWAPISVKCYLCSFNNAMGTLGCIH